MRHKEIKNMVFCALLIALIAVLSAPPLFIGFVFAIPFLGTHITILHIPVIIGAVILGRKYAWILGLAFGLGSFWASFAAGAILFQNPLVSVLPRLLFGIATYELFAIFKKVIENVYISIGVTAVVATIVHSILVFVAILLFGSALYQDLETFINTILLPSLTFNMVIEIILAPLIAVPVYRALLGVMNKENTSEVED